MPVLEIGNVFVGDVVFSERTALENGVLFVNKEEMRELLFYRDCRLKSVDIQLVRPGESARLVCIKDFIPPRRKIHGFRGNGRTHNMSNVLVTTLGQIINGQEGVLYMNEPGARLSPVFSGKMHICLDISVKDGLIQHQHEEALRLAGWRAAQYLGLALFAVEPDEIETFSFGEQLVDPELFRVVCMYPLLLQGLLHHNFIDNNDPVTSGVLPCYANPLEMLDGLIVSGQCVSFCDKTTTYHHWNNAVIRELLKANGKELDFVGVVLSGLLTNMDEKQRMAEGAVELSKKLDPFGAIIPKEGFGNPDADIMMMVEFLEKAGIKTVSIHNEYAGQQGVSFGLADSTPYADTIVSVGNSNELYTLPPVDRTIGPVENLTILAGAREDSVHPDGSITVEAQVIAGMTHQSGDLCLTCEEL